MTRKTRAELATIFADNSAGAIDAAAMRDFVDSLPILGPQNGQVGTSYVFQLSDMDNGITLTNAAAITATIPPNTDVAFPVGTVLACTRGGAGLVTFAAGDGVMIRKPTGIKPNRSMGAIARLVRRLNDALGATSVIVTHDVAETLPLVDYVYFMAGGRVLAQGAPADVRRIRSRRQKSTHERLTRLLRPARGARPCLPRTSRSKIDRRLRVPGQLTTSRAMRIRV